VQIQGARSPYDGDWVYGSKRVGHHPDVPPRVARLLKQPQGRYRACGLYVTAGDQMAVDHILPNKNGGRDARDNVPLLHRQGHDTKTARETGCQGTYDTRHVAEEPDERKRSGPVL
jgi:RNA-directed DNA polymerase